MTLAIGVLVAAVWSALLWLGLRELFSRPVFSRVNVRGRSVPTAVGLIVPVAVTASVAVLSIAEALGAAVDAAALASGRLAVTTTVGFALLGLLDDLAVDQGVSGYRGHVQAILSGRLTAGALKLAGGGALALVVVAPFSDDSGIRLMVDGALVALGANLANLLDRAPGRLGKVALASGTVLLVVTGADPELTGPAMIVGAVAVLIVPDLRERLMLGDAGANPVGATLALGVVLVCAPATRNVVALVLLGLNLVSEVVSFSSVIERVPPLRLLDRLGRPPADGSAH